MINQLGQVMLYVSNLDQSKQFWTEKLGFEVIADNPEAPVRGIEIAPPGAATRMVLFNKEQVAALHPEMNYGTPSLMFFTDKFDELYSGLKEKNVTVGEIVEIPERVFNFADDEDNYFAVMEK